MISSDVSARRCFYSALVLVIFCICVSVAEMYSLWDMWGIPRASILFFDFHAVLAAADCNSQGYNVFLENPCDIWSRPHVYSSIWLLISHLGIGSNHLLIVGGIISGLFLIIFLVIHKPSTLKELIIITLLLLSPAITLGVERANNDLIVFILLVAGCKLLTSTVLLNRGLAFGLFYLSGILKFYPFVAFSVFILTCRSRKTFWMVTPASIVLAIMFIGVTFSDYQYLSMPEPETKYVFGAKLIFSFTGSTWPYYKLSILLWGALFALTVFKTPKGTSLATKAGDEFMILLYVAGASISLAAFVLYSNYDYRCIFLLLCTPLLLELSHHRNEHLGFNFHANSTLILMIVVLWAEMFVSVSTFFEQKDIIDQSFVFFVRWIEQPLTWIMMYQVLFILVSLTKPSMFSHLGLQQRTNSD